MILILLVFIILEKKRRLQECITAPAIIQKTFHNKYMVIVLTENWSFNFADAHFYPVLWKRHEQKRHGGNPE